MDRLTLAIGAALATRPWKEALLSLRRSRLNPKQRAVIQALESGDRLAAADALGLTLKNGEALLDCLFRTLQETEAIEHTKEVAMQVLGAAMACPEKLAEVLEKKAKELRGQ